MSSNFQELKLVSTADVYQDGKLAGHLRRQPDGSVEFSYTVEYLASGRKGIAFSLPASNPTYSVPSGGLPAFFSGLLPEGHRLTVLKNAAKTSLSDELTLLMIVGADTPGDVSIVPSGRPLTSPPVVAEVLDPAQMDFAALSRTLDLHSLPGVQDKISATMLTTPVATREFNYLLKLDTQEHPHLVANEHLHLEGAKKLKIPTAKSALLRDKNGVEGLLVERFDRRIGADRTTLTRRRLEDAMQVLNLPPSAKYSISSEEVCLALSEHCHAPLLAVRNLYLQFVYAWLTGNGDLHGKNVSILADERERFSVAPVYDVPCTLLYGDDTMALTLAGKTKNLKRKHWAQFAGDLGLNERSANAANKLALNAAGSVDLNQLPIDGSPLRGAQRELRHRRFELEGQ
ncbi:type II toxin-antitoxin system HipA family toxin [Glutamicibacter uratoxydans]|uniref:type II toxin-antitoxin system HipA family toxin n=1 Tax=Glutamicibacter uratoxydans TaxID=43667 RepID=UPI003D6F674C